MSLAPGIETVAQLFLQGPTWDGNVISKSDRDDAVDAGYVFRHEGWQSLTEDGLKAALAIDFSGWADARYNRKQHCN